MNISIKTLSTHLVTLSDEVNKKLTNNKVTKEELLDREPNTLILSSFELTLISRYFSDYEKSVKKWCSS